MVAGLKLKTCSSYFFINSKTDVRLNLSSFEIRTLSGKNKQDGEHNYTIFFVNFDQAG